MIQVKNKQQFKTPEMKEYRQEWFNVPRRNTEKSGSISLNPCSSRLYLAELDKQNSMLLTGQGSQIRRKEPGLREDREALLQHPGCCQQPDRLQGVAGTRWFHLPKHTLKDHNA